MKEHDIHRSIIDFHTTEDPGLEHSVVMSSSGDYISQYVSHYPEDVERSPELHTIMQHIMRNIRKGQASDLKILSAIPRSSLVPRSSGGFAWDSCVVLDIPIAKTNADFLKTLATIFHGPPKEEYFPVQVPESGTPNRILTEKFYARVLVAKYYHENPDMFSDIARHARTPAMWETALAALTFMSAIITANWDSSAFIGQIPENDSMYGRLQEFPRTGIELLCDVGKSSSMLSYLIGPADTIPGIRSGGENAAYRVAMTKFDVVRLLHERIQKEDVPDNLKAMVRECVAQGPLGRTNAAGSRIGTLDL